MKHLEIKAKCIGDEITSLSKCKELAKAYGEEIELDFNRFSITVRPSSELQDLFAIYQLEVSRRMGDR